MDTKACSSNPSITGHLVTGLLQYPDFTLSRYQSSPDMIQYPDFRYNLISGQLINGHYKLGFLNSIVRVLLD